jgi:hypothetical protein
MAKRRWPEWTPTVAKPRNLVQRMSVLEARIFQLEGEIATVTATSGATSHKSNSKALRKRAGVLLAEHAKRDGPTKNTFRIANCYRSMEEKPKTDVESAHLTKRMERLNSEAQCHQPPRQRLEGLHHAALLGNEAAIQFFHASGFDVNAPSSSEGAYSGWRPAHLAVSGGRANTLLKLLQLGAGLLETTDTGLSCLHLAVIKSCATNRLKTAQEPLNMLRLVLHKMALSEAGLNMEDDQGSTARSRHGDCSGQ